jgi:hypothetical protein
MSHTVVCLNIYCTKTADGRDPVYRLFLNDQLVVERRFWPKTPNNFIQEQITLNDNDTKCNIWLKNVFGNRGRIKIKSVKLFDGDTRKPLSSEVKNVNGRYIFETAKR